MNSFKQSITSADFWLRLFYVILLALAWQVAELLLMLIAIVQVGFQLFTGAPNATLSGYGNSLSQYVWQIGRFLSCASEQKPWPFLEWPAADAEWQRRQVVPPTETPESPDQPPKQAS